MTHLDDPWVMMAAADEESAAIRDHEASAQAAHDYAAYVAEMAEREAEERAEWLAVVEGEEID